MNNEKVIFLTKENVEYMNQLMDSIVQNWDIEETELKLEE